MCIVRCAVPREEEQHHEHDDAHHRPGDAFHQLSAQAGVLGKPALEENERNEHADRGELFASIDDHLVEVELVDQGKQACCDGRDDEGVGDVRLDAHVHGQATQHDHGQTELPTEGLTGPVGPGADAHPQQGDGREHHHGPRKVQRAGVT